MSTLLIISIAVVLLAIVFDFVNGFHDASNIVATMIASRSVTPEKALVTAAVCEFLGPLIFGTAVAKTIGKGLVSPDAVDVYVISAALLGAIFWNLLTWWLGLPSSSSHALIGGIAGAVIAGPGLAHLNVAGFVKIVIALVTSPIIGMAIGFGFMKLFTHLSRGFTPRANEGYKKIQYYSSIGLALSHGANDAQKSMGIITMVLILYHKGTAAADPGHAIPDYVESFTVPFWVIVSCALAIAMGTATGGWSIIKTVGSGIYKLRPIHSFSAQSASAFVIIAASRLGFPVSTTHIVSSSIMGVGSAERMKAVKWHKAGEIVATWFLTIPAAAIVAALTHAALVTLRQLM